jgi:hypothetical protein
MRSEVEVAGAMRLWVEVRSMAFLAGVICFAPHVSYPQTLTTPTRYAPEHRGDLNSVCDETALNPAASGALRLVCERASIAHTLPSMSSPQVIIIGFVGGFANPDDLQHPENLFASYLSEHYGGAIRARSFSNHDAKGALSYVEQLLDVDHDGVISSEERKNARIIIYGHSWGASETAAFARELGALEIPVLLTIQLDIISKPGQKPTIIPPNVANAINLYQPEGPLHGRTTIVAMDPATTTILGNIQKVYDHSPVNCANYNWFVRTFNKPHHEIENDAHVWDQVASLIDAEVW